MVQLILNVRAVVLNPGRPICELNRDTIHTLQRVTRDNKPAPGGHTASSVRAVQLAC